MLLLQEDHMKNLVFTAIVALFVPISAVHAQSNNTIRCQGIANTYFNGCMDQGRDIQTCLTVQQAVFKDCIRPII